MPENELSCGNSRIDLTGQTARRILIVSGERKAGKTAFCTELAGLAFERRLTLAGVVSKARFVKGSENGKIAWNLVSGDIRLLASTNPGELQGNRIGVWTFDGEVTRWANACFDQITRCDLLIVDEVGPLELEQGKGWPAALEALRRVEYNLAVVVIRPGLVDKGLALFPAARILEITPGSDLPALAHEVLAGAFKG